MPVCRSCLVRLAGAVLAFAALAPTPGRADFFDDARRTFQSDIPHFFQDDIPCAFGGQPTSGARRSCNANRQAPRQPARKTPNRNTAPSEQGPPEQGQR